ncbi:unnamed protein product [Pieris brassicae]|uniref:Uncharacterized protein n=1 Tax=Pieris brassicae TaxID=7116 RepID=A0A9P0TSD7_PIEBR|nr:unnamed protein product [Pieris brassicae]
MHVQNRLVDAPAVCLLDGWTLVNNQTYVATTAHFINKDAELETYLLGFLPKDERQKTHADLKMEEIGKRDLIHKVSAILPDNWRNFPCFDNTMNLIVEDSLKSLSE